MQFYIMTLFPEMIQGCMQDSILGRASRNGLIEVCTYNIRDYSTDKHRHVDDYPYGGGAGMVMQPGPIYDCWEDITKNMMKKPRVLYMTPQGRVFDQNAAKELAVEDSLIFLCGHYEGVDERVIEEIVTDEFSIGDYVLTGGELPAMVMIDTISRMIPGVLGNEDSAPGDSFQNGLLEYPQYTRPEVFHGHSVPEVLLSGHHANIDLWRRQQSLIRTKERRPELLKKPEVLSGLSKKDLEFLQKV